jgi:hypothetical protein
MYVYRYNKEARAWIVGVFALDHTYESIPQPKWLPLRDFETEEECAAFINYLNGGKGLPFPGGAG